MIKKARKSFVRLVVKKEKYVSASHTLESEKVMCRKRKSIMFEEAA